MSDESDLRFSGTVYLQTKRCDRCGVRLVVFTLSKVLYDKWCAEPYCMACRDERDEA